MVIVNFTPEGKRAEANIGESLLEVARRAGVDLIGPCNGKALCGKCMVRILAGSDSLSAITEDEKVALTPKKLNEGYRLSCRCKILKENEISVFVPSESRSGEYILLVEGWLFEERFDPVIQNVEATLPSKARGVLDEVILPSGMKKRFSLHALQKFSRMADVGVEKKFSLIIYDDEVVDVRESCRPLGFAFDVGTTKVAGYLVDLTNGKTLSTVSDINPQIAYGEDVISRLDYALKEGVKGLQEKIVGCINELMKRACNATGTSVEDVYELVIVGNTIMHHILLCIEPKRLAYFPYTPITRESMCLMAESIGIRANAEARVFMPPLIAGYIGSDVVADIVATNMQEHTSPVILVDIGTNTEIVVKKDERLVACSTASGPAFEGAHITYGMRAVTGAIYRAEVMADGEINYSVIGNVRPRGITGSAVVDIIAGLFTVGLIDKSGRLNMNAGTKRIRMSDRGYPEFVIEYKENTAIGEDITLTQKDIREIQLAKAAIRTGMNILMKKLKVNMSEVERLYVAGTFGFFLNPISAKTIGLYPDVELSRVRIVGNAAGAGARAMLLSKTLRGFAQEVARKIEYVELAAEPEFQKEFIKMMPIPERDVI
ncbi:MAG: ASKHA domain-containing protein [Nitrososphaerota archaeon]|nr:ASKHA domain-containing protein [Aigarchaeota archaeon]MDW8077203.1 ASKHA domain-containing protein [Nitrososphaerota archaeon]